MGRKPDDEAANHLVWKDGFATSHDLKELGYRRHCPLAPVRTTELADPAGGEPTRWIEWCNSVIPVARFLDRPGFLVLHLAGIEPDPIVDSAAVAMHTCLRSILATCGDGVPVEFEKIRTALEVRQYMKARRFEYSHIIVIGHGANDGIHLLDESPIAKDDFAELLGCATVADSRRSSRCAAIPDAMTWRPTSVMWLLMRMQSSERQRCWRSPTG